MKIVTRTNTGLPFDSTLSSMLLAARKRSSGRSKFKIRSITISHAHSRNWAGARMFSYQRIN